MPVRWALEEVGLRYQTRLVPFSRMKEAAHMSRQPFGQIPTFEEGDLTLFESGAIVLHIAQQHAGLLSDEPKARAREIGWMFAALATVDPPIFDLDMSAHLDGHQPWHHDRLSLLESRVRDRLTQLAVRLGEHAWLEDAFSAGDLLMVASLRRLHGSGVLAEHPILSAYVARAEARPAFKRAFAAQLADYHGHGKAGGTPS